MAIQTVTLRKSRDRLGSRYLGATLRADGTLTIQGQDLGRGVEGVLGSGNTEYEWTWILDPQAAVALAKSLGCDHVLDGLLTRFSGEASAHLKRHLDESGIKYRPWSRIGD